jgi:hypothetical protein
MPMVHPIKAHCDFARKRRFVLLKRADPRVWLQVSGLVMFNECQSGSQKLGRPCTALFWRFVDLMGRANMPNSPLVAS